MDKKSKVEDMELIGYAHGQKIFESKGKAKKVNQEYKDFCKWKVF
jgi:hypothetical protein